MADIAFIRRSNTHCKRSGMDDPMKAFNALEIESRTTGEVTIYTRAFPCVCCVCGGRCQQYVKFVKDGITGVTRFGQENDKDCCVIGINCCVKQ